MFCICVGIWLGNDKTAGTVFYGEVELNSNSIPRDDIFSLDTTVEFRLIQC
ncbi:hypothetical protein VIBNIMADA3020_910027 [Vibrio nigripulchritudo MADA3020]|nr:hypothetical protein VIBNIMADA3020_910027 [Vibrio nigripulchritudo MADA3020]CCN52318.1 hypothetical protein VIBNIMADA3021_1230027 [Vibrio nigripulchritudo MADA3021]